VLALAPTEAEDDVIRVTGARWAWPRPAPDRVWLAESIDHHAVLATPGPRKLYAAKRAERRSERRYWLDALERSRGAAKA
jgi:hypothetical protein